MSNYVQTMITTWSSSAIGNTDAIANQWTGMKDHLAASVVVLHVYFPIAANRRCAGGLIKEKRHVLQYLPCILKVQTKVQVFQSLLGTTCRARTTLLVMDNDIELHLKAFSRLSTLVLL